MQSENRHKRRGEIGLALLESLMNVSLSAGDMFAAFLNAGYGASVDKFEYEYRKIKRLRAKNDAQNLVDASLRQRYYSMVYKLKRDGLVRHYKRDGKRFFSITGLGVRRLLKLRERMAVHLLASTYSREPDTRWMIVAFDIPERERRKRAWLRSALRSLGLVMIQKSLWRGKVKIPPDFLKDLHQLGLVEYVEIFEVTKAGTLRNLT